TPSKVRFFRSPCHQLLSIVVELRRIVTALCYGQEPGMTLSRKKQEERRQVHLFADLIGRPELKGAAPGEEPDFVHTTATGSLGIEVAEFVLDDRPKVTKTGKNADLDNLFLSPPPATSRGKRKAGSELMHREKVMVKFRVEVGTEITRRGIVPDATIYLITPEDGSVPNEKEIPAAAQQLADLLEETLRTYRTGPAQQFSPRRAPLVTFTDIVHVLPTKPGSGLRIEGGPLGYVQDCFQGGTQARIVAKARKIPAYRAKCNELWLLLVATGMSEGSLVDLNRFDTAGIPIPTPGTPFFDRIYILDEKNRRYRLIWDGRESV